MTAKGTVGAPTCSSSSYQMRHCRIWSRNAENYPVLFSALRLRFLNIVAKKLTELSGQFCQKNSAFSRKNSDRYLYKI
jgi:hypothetical protein